MEQRVILDLVSNFNSLLLVIDKDCSGTCILRSNEFAPSVSGVMNALELAKDRITDKLDAVIKEFY